MFVDGEVDQETFEPVIDAHLRECEIAGRDAHDYYAEDAATRTISVNPVKPDADPNAEDCDGVTNIGSYVGEYIGSYGEPLFERNVEELAFRAAVWATGSQLVRFSTGANEVINEVGGFDEEQSDEAEAPETDLVVKDGFDRENPTESVDGSPFEEANPSWSFEGIGVVDRDGETVHKVESSGAEYREIGDASHLDPPKRQPRDRPQRSSSESDLSSH